MPAPTPEQRQAWKDAKEALDAIHAERDELVKHTNDRFLAAIEAVDLAEEACQSVAHCEGCGEPIFVGDKMLGGDDPLCGECAPTYADLLTTPESFVDAEGEPLTADAARALYDRHIASGGQPTDSMAVEVTD